MSTQTTPPVPAKPTETVTAQPTVEDRVAKLETTVTQHERFHQSLLAKLRSKLAYFDK